MNRTPTIRPIALVFCAALAAAACSNHESSMPSTPSYQRASGIQAAATTADTVYLADVANRSWVTARDGTDTLLREIIDGVENNPESVAVDNSSNLYVGTATTVVKYAAGSIVPTGFYSLAGYIGANPYTPDIVVDAGKVYVALAETAGWKGSNTGAILVFPVMPFPNGPVKPTQILFMPTAAHPRALTLDAQGNLYVQVSTGSSWPHPGYVYEFKPGNVIGTQLPLRLGDGEAASLAFDAQGNLIACDDYTNTIDVFPPGATKPARTISSGMKGCRAFALSSDEKTLYATDQPHYQDALLPSAVIHKYDYASGALEATLTSGITSQFVDASGLAVAPPAPF
jgi:hypothetical protein